MKRPVREYIKLTRLSRATGALADRERRILDVALEYGFGSHETFTRAFKEAYGVTPEQYRKEPAPLNHFERPNLLLGYVMAEEGVPLISDGLVLELNRRVLDAPMRFIGFHGHVPIEGQLPLGEATGVDVPGELWKAFYDRVKPKVLLFEGQHTLGVAYQGDAPEGSFCYFVGAQAVGEAEGNGLEIWTLPAGPYVVCVFEAATFYELTNAALNKAMQYSGQWVERNGLKTGAFVAELYFGDAFTTKEARMELWFPLEG